MVADVDHPPHPRRGHPPGRHRKGDGDDIGARRTHHHGNHRYVFRLGRNHRQREEIRIASTRCRTRNRSTTARSCSEGNGLPGHYHLRCATTRRRCNGCTPSSREGRPRSTRGRRSEDLRARVVVVVFQGTIPTPLRSIVLEHARTWPDDADIRDYAGLDDKDLALLETVFGTRYVPAKVAVTLNKAIARGIENGDVEPGKGWQLLANLAEAYLSGLDADRTARKA